jgi:hypothetical protein
MTMLVFIHMAREQVRIAASIECVFHFVFFDWMLMKTRIIEKKTYFSYNLNHCSYLSLIFPVSN